jgi:hypothetical protein
MSGLEIIGLVGSAIGARSAYQQGKIGEMQAEQQADLLRQKKTQAVAASQRDAMQEDRKMKLIASRALALSAAGGTAGSISDQETVADIYGEGAYRKSLALYQGTATAYDLEEQAKAKEYEGYAIKQASRGKQIASILSGFGYGTKGFDSMSTKYGKEWDNYANNYSDYR